MLNRLFSAGSSGSTLWKASKMSSKKMLAVSLVRTEAVRSFEIPINLSSPKAVSSRTRFISAFPTSITQPSR